MEERCLLFFISRIAAMDFFTVPTITFGMLYCFFVIGHDRRRILHCNITKHPTSCWIIQQLRVAFPFATAARSLIHDRDAKYGRAVPAAIRSWKINAVQTSFASPWQNVRRALGGELAPRAARPWDCSQRTASEVAPFRVRFLPSRRSHAPWTGQGNARAQNSLPRLGSRAFP
jgi:hypothetical protein